MVFFFFIDLDHRRVWLLQMALSPTWHEAGARLLITRFFKSFIQTGCIIFLEEGGTIFTFKGTERKCSLKVSLKVHSMQFYWKIATQADLGLADAFLHGDFSFVDKNEGLLNLIMWTPVLFTAALSSATYFIRHVSNRNTLTQARRNISRHYDLSNELFSLFMDETMLYSCAIFKCMSQTLERCFLYLSQLLIEYLR
ncbi:putative primary amine oxidase-like [Capsicum annuum]|nr:putative primary amine oxidase-like [Capsicum annuum]KAF3679359.1 putative primary amine oxidase-like [Capsicum annuum]